MIISETRVGYPTLYFAFCNLYEQTSNMYNEQEKLITLT